MWAPDFDALRRKRGPILKEAVNDVPQRGLGMMSEGEQPRSVFTTKNTDLGTPWLPLDNIADALAAIEGEGFR